LVVEGISNSHMEFLNYNVSVSGGRLVVDMKNENISSIVNRGKVYKVRFPRVMGKCTKELASNVMYSQLLNVSRMVNDKGMRVYNVLSYVREWMLLGYSKDMIVSALMRCKMDVTRLRVKVVVNWANLGYKVCPTTTTTVEPSLDCKDPGSNTGLVKE